MDEESKIEGLREEIRKYATVGMFNPITSIMFTTNKLTLNRIAVYAASLQSARRYYLSWLVLRKLLIEIEIKKSFLQQLWNAYGRGF